MAFLVPASEPASGRRRPALLALGVAALLALWAALRPRAPAAALHAAAAPPPAGAAARLPHCAYEEAVQRAVDSADRPQLSRGQLLFIAAAVRTQTRLAGAPANFLVFGLGHDSATWQEANCGGRTVFLEEDRSWLDKIKGGAPGLEAYLVTYRGRVDQADAFFEAPWLMEMPPAVSSTCFDAILVDGPTGYDAASPGRMEAAHFAVEHAIECMKAGNTSSTVIFLHDATRPVEKQIVARLFRAAKDADVEDLGELTGPAGDLVGFRLALRA